MPEAIPRLNQALEGRYRVEREVGRGGMASVYRAADLRHGRTVALKVLRPELAAAVGAERFLDEIRTTAQLQHPHILPLHDSGDADGLLFYVMPFVEGESLRERLDRERQLPVDDALRIATDVGEALDLAHRKGVVHRDVKPGNVLLADGRALVSDFGIALAVSRGGGDRLTATGSSLGTPHYMSPEQATGEPWVGPATDVYGLACVVFEMLVGEPPFTGSTPQAVLGKILTEDPPSARATRASVPEHVSDAIERALQKVPADRFTSAADFAGALADPSFRFRAAGEALAPRAGWRWTSVLWPAVSVGLAAALAVSSMGEDEPTPVTRFSLGVASAAMAPVVSPDGRSVILRVEEDGTYRLAIRRLDDLTLRPVAGTEGAEILGAAGFSPAGDEVAFVAEEQLRVVGVAGGGARVLADSVFCCPHWEEDGNVYFTTRGRTLNRVPGRGGAVEPVTTIRSGETGHFDLALLPSLGAAVFHVNGSEPHLETLDLQSGERSDLTPGLSPRLLDSGHLVWVADGRIVAAPFDARGRALSGDPVTIAEDVHVMTAPYPLFDVSPSGTLVHQTRDLGRRAQPVWVDREGRPEPVDPAWTMTVPGSANFGLKISPDGSRVAFWQDKDVWVKGLPEGTVDRLTFDEDVLDILPSWSPNGRAVTFTSNRGGRLELWARSADGAGEPTRLGPELDREVAYGFLGPKGEWLIVRTAGMAGRNHERDVLGVRMDDPGAQPVPLAATGAVEGSPALSPDGRWLAYHSDETGRSEVFVRPFPDVESGKWQVSRAGGTTPRWSESGELFYVDGRTMRAVRYRVEGGFRATGDEALLEIPDGYTVVTGGPFYDVSRDGSRFLLVAPYDLQGVRPSEVVVVQGVDQELRRR